MTDDKETRRKVRRPTDKYVEELFDADDEVMVIFPNVLLGAFDHDVYILPQIRQRLLPPRRESYGDTVHF